MSDLVTENLPLIAAAPDGIQKLRGLILELAVRGKLVPQDPKDEPASELLKRIAKERARLEAEGTCKKLKATPLVGEDERPFALPEGWHWCRFPDVADYRMGKTPPTKDATYWSDNGIPWVSISDMVHGETVLTTSRTVSNTAQEKVFKSFPAPAGTLLMSFKLTVGKVATLGIDAFHNEAIISIFPFSGVAQDYLSRFLPMIAKGGNSKNALMGDTLNSESLSLLAIPLPPLPEQHRIVARVDELMALCDRLEAEQTDAAEAHTRLVDALLATLTASRDAAECAANWQRLSEHFDTLFTTEASITALKQTVLQLAVMGRLVPQDPTDEPASELLKRIEAEKARLVKEGKIRKSKAVEPVGEDEWPFEVPTGWEWVRFGGVTICRDGERIPVSRDEREQRAKVYDYYGASGIIDKIDGYLFDKPLLLIGEDGANLINRSTPIAFIARGKYWVNNHAHVIDGISEEFLRFVELYINATDLKPYVTGTAQPKMNQEKLNRIPVALPPLPEQHRIVARVDELMALCERLQADLQEARQSASNIATALTTIGAAA